MVRVLEDPGMQAKIAANARHAQLLRSKWEIEARQRAQAQAQQQAALMHIGKTFKDFGEQNYKDRVAAAQASAMAKQHEQDQTQRRYNQQLKTYEDKAGEFDPKSYTPDQQAEIDELDSDIGKVLGSDGFTEQEKQRAMIPLLEKRNSIVPKAKKPTLEETAAQSVFPLDKSGMPGALMVQQPDGKLSIVQPRNTGGGVKANSPVGGVETPSFKEYQSMRDTSLKKFAIGVTDTGEAKYPENVNELVEKDIREAFAGYARFTGQQLPQFAANQPAGPQGPAVLPQGQPQPQSQSPPIDPNGIALPSSPRGVEGEYDMPGVNGDLLSQTESDDMPPGAIPEREKAPTPLPKYTPNKEAANKEVEKVRSFIGKLASMDKKYPNGEKEMPPDARFEYQQAREAFKSIVRTGQGDYSTRRIADWKSFMVPRKVPESGNMIPGQIYGPFKDEKGGGALKWYMAVTRDSAKELFGYASE